ncbi:MAG TPA: UDP-N-acetylglucosamine 1-carboxyvinyltransferase [Gammaproteobacteria bacterium]|nr:UDP-N-acetylglucosamine 1-carboxyvinyltransferase [Gammaproteobacteria bacterium]HIK76647.1 UDP-N-acetylglucosamine 1-carboxyvinyltransferase [Gammaproteobacteria bacterium]
MQKLRIKGRYSLNGELNISGSKNAALPIMAACLLCSEEVEIDNIPALRDINTMIRLITYMGVKISKTSDNTVKINAHRIKEKFAPYDLVKTMRASILVLGPLLARFGEAVVSLPGGCAIGARPVNLHIEGLKAMGAEIDLKNGYIHAKARRLKGCEFSFNPVSVTGTANLMMAACLAEGATILNNCAKEPEIVNLGEFLISMGAKINGLGSDHILIEGVDKLEATACRVIPDRIEAATFLIAALITKSNLKLNGALAEHLREPINLLEEAGASISIAQEFIEVTSLNEIIPVSFTTSPYPGIPTDIQAQLMVLNVLAQGESSIEETIFENRFMHVLELQRMGANIKLQSNIAKIKGVSQLQSAQVMATDLRASAALVLAALVANGETEIDRIYHIDRGYENIDKKLSLIGAQVERIES